MNAIEKDDSLSNVIKTARLKELVNKVKTYESFYVNVGKQTAEPKNGGYEINSLNEAQLVYFVAETLRNAADALASYQKANT